MNRVLVVDKPRGPTSHDVVERLRRSTGIRKIGHAGTLDPTATGVILALVGRATRIASFLMELEKEYRGDLVLGTTTDTQDAAGNVLTRSDASGVTREALEDAFERFSGEIEQVPPMVSALKRGGKPLYELARKGIEVEREPRAVTIHRLALLAYDPPRVEFDVVCSKGTYVRTLAADIGESLGCGAHLGELRRLRVGPFGVDRALPLAELEKLGRGANEAGLSMFEALEGLPAVELDERELDTISTGGAITLEPERLAGSVEPHVRLARGDELVAVGKRAGSSGDDDPRIVVRPVRVFTEPFGGTGGGRREDR